MDPLQFWEDGMATLYLTERGSVVKKAGDTLEVHIPEDPDRALDKRKVRVPLLKVTQVVVFGNITLTSPALAALLEQGAEVCFCSAYGQFLGRLASPLNKNGLVRLAQHRAHQDPLQSFTLARAFVYGKLNNMRVMLMRANRKRDEAAIDKAVGSIRQIQDQVADLEPDLAGPPDPAHPQADSAYGRLQGLEGSGTALYFGVFDRLLKGDWKFERRCRRPPRDPVNALLSFGYTLLTNQVASAVNVVGLDPYIGFLHSSQYGKPALALDVMETFRPLVVDSVVLTLLNNEMLSQQDFREELGSWLLTEKGRRSYLHKFEERLDTEIRHPVFGYQASYRRSLELEVRLVAKWLAGEIPEYKPFIAR